MNPNPKLFALTTAGALLTIAANASAQNSTVAPVTPAPSTSGWHLPLHAAAAREDAPRWASGDTYKASFDDGMTFYPVLGDAAPHNLPWRWRTTTIARSATDDVTPVTADTATLGAPRVANHTGFRYVLTHDTVGVDEIYEIRAEGVEQLFEVAAPLAGAGDLVVRGAVDSLLECAPRPPAHAELLFRDDRGQPVVGYGAATAIDANGETLALDTAFDGNEISIRVPSAWLDSAAYPLVIDPLTQRRTIGASSGGRGYSPQLTRDETRLQFAGADVRAVSASDRDLRMYRLLDDISNRLILFGEITAADTPHVSLAQAHGPDKWLLAYQRETATDREVRVYFHDCGNEVLGSGTTRTVLRPIGAHDSAPCIGGSRTGSGAYLVLRRDAGPTPGNTDASRPVGVPVNPVLETVGVGTVLFDSPPGSRDADRPQVNQRASGVSGWLATWQEYDGNIRDDAWNVVGRRIHGDGSLGSATFVLGEPRTTTDHAICPAPAGMSGEFGVFYTTTPNAGSRYVGDQAAALWFQRIEWDVAAATPSVVGTPALVEQGATNFSVQFGQPSHRAAFDRLTNGNWGVTWKRTDLREIRFARVAYDGDVVENLVVEADPMVPFAGFFQPTMCFDGSTPAFVLAYATQSISANDPTWARRYLFPADCAAVPYGNPCAGNLNFNNGPGNTPPLAGSPYTWLTLTNARASSPSWLIVGTAPTDVRLPTGGTGCRLLVDPMPELLTAAFVMTSAGGNRSVPLAIPGEAAGLDLYWQFIQFDDNQLWSSNALEMRIR